MTIRVGPLYPRHPHRNPRHELMALPSTCGEEIAVAWPRREEWLEEERRKKVRATYKRCGKHGVTDCLVCEVNEPEGRKRVRERHQAKRKARRQRWFAERKWLDDLEP